MKYSITISDLDLPQTQAVLSKLQGETTFNVQPVAVVQNAPAEDDDNTVSAVDVSGQVDSRGFPWDGRIHSSNKKISKDGTWQARRGVKPNETEAVETELRARFAAPQPQPVAPMVVAPAPLMAAPQPQPVAVEAMAAAEMFAAAPVPVAPQPIAMPAQLQPVPVAPQPVAAPARDFGTLVSRIQVASAAKKLTPELMGSFVVQINQAFNAQINNLMDVASRADMVDYVHQQFDVNGL